MKIIELPWKSPPLSMNDRGASLKAVYAKSREVTSIRETSRILAIAARLPRDCGHASVELHYRPKTTRRRDTDNLTATAKPIYDGLVDFGLVPDDTPEYMAKLEPVIHRKGKPSMWLEIVTSDESRELPA
ncbi:hypothetical protein [Rhodococcus sp. 1168]|uniref:hypothetical protein n=1 Tax=Rhodococcus sp. 1168 TaxID=2018041 RepID=UPI000A09B0E7|nr:hypothetical protein [Rhodococcus sp. 1168]ORI13451.1 hypothetical protein BJI47_22675 [Rhodococcus sp. 1168]